MLHAFERGSCRGDSFGGSSKISTPKITKLFEGYIAVLKKGDEEAIEEWIDVNLSCEEIMLTAAVIGSDCDWSERDLKPTRARFNKVKKGTSFSVSMEESTVGFGKSITAAKVALVDAGDDSDSIRYEVC